MFQLVLLRITEAYFRHRWLHLLPIALMTVVALIYPATVKSTYMTSGTIYVQGETLLASLNAVQNEGFGWVTPAQATASEINQLFHANAFLHAIAEQTDLGLKLTGDPKGDREITTEIGESIWVASLGNNLLTIGASHEDPRVSYQLASSVINTFLQWKINLKLEGSKAAQHFFVKLTDDYNTELEPARQQLITYLTDHPAPVRGERSADEVAEIAKLQAIVDQRLARVRGAESKEENARLAEVETESDVRQTYFTVDEPIMPIDSDRSRKKIAITMIACVIGGFIITLISVIGAALLDRSFRFPIDVRHGLYLPVLASVPEVMGDEGNVIPNIPVRASMANEQLIQTKVRKSQRLFGFK